MHRYRIPSEFNSRSLVGLCLSIGLLLPPTSQLHAEGRVIEEIIVSAQKREQSLQDVPVSVSSFSDDFMRDIAVQDIGELVQYTPNVKFDNTVGYTPVLTIRGFGTPPLGRGLEPSVGLQIDEVFYGRSTYTNDTNFDLLRMEVLRGPQGTLFGKNTIAGVFNFNSRDPDFDWTGHISIGTSDPYGDKRVELAQSFSLWPEKLAMRVAARFRDKDQATYNTARDEQDLSRDEAVRVKVNWLVNDDTEIMLNYWTAKNHQEGLILQQKRASQRSLEEFQLKDPRADAIEFNRYKSEDSPSYSYRDTESISLKYSQLLPNIGALENSELTVIVADSEMLSPFAIDGDFSPINFIEYSTEGGKPDYYNQSQIEVRFGATLPRLFGMGQEANLVAGIFYTENESGVSVRQTQSEGVVEYVRAGAFVDQGGAAPLVGLAAVNHQHPLVVDLVYNGFTTIGFDSNALRETLFAFNDIKADSLAIFSQLDWQINDQLSAILGLRYNQDYRHGRLAAGHSDVTVIAPLLLGAERFDETREATDYDFTPKLTLSWHANEELTFFATATTGFKSGGFASGVFNNDNLEFEPETARAYELGMKSRLLGGSLMLNATAFYTEFENLQVRNFDGRSLFVKNAANAKTQGFEFDFFWLPPIPYVAIGGSGGYVDAKYIDYLCAPIAVSNEDRHSDPSCESDGSAAEFQDLSGESLAYAPKLSGSLYSAAEIPLTEQLKFMAGVDLLYQGEHYIDTDNDDFAFQQATTKVNARLGLKGGDDKWSVIINGKNLSGEKTSVLVLDQANLPGNYISAALPSEPSYHLDLRLSW